MNTTIIDEMKKYGISEATVKNWEKLDTVATNRLKKRANKHKSTKRIIPKEYMNDSKNIKFINDTVEYIDNNNIDILSAIYSLGINLLKKYSLYQEAHVTKTLQSYQNIVVIDALTQCNIPLNEKDILGLIYQSYLKEGKKNILGSYYTPSVIIKNMMSGLDFSNNEVFLDPCCGSGAFLLEANAKNPNQLYGIDNDEIAVLIAKINLLLKYKKEKFIPQIYVLDFLNRTQTHLIYNKQFDYIVTNPPWGAMNQKTSTEELASNETFSHFFVKAFKQLNKNGKIRFLFPEAILNVKTHRDIRSFLLNKTNIVSITKYEKKFTGVTTNYIDIQCNNSVNTNTLIVYENGSSRLVDKNNLKNNQNVVFNLLSSNELRIVNLVKSYGKYTLKDSIWGLGIVTGDNKTKVLSHYENGAEKIYIGKDINPYLLKKATHYIHYDRNNLQQVAKDDIYRASEKLIYRFISHKLEFAYDDKKTLTLNSANILIPNIPNMSIKTVMAFLDSSLFQFMYEKMFGEVKILKGNLIELPFPELTEKQNQYIEMMVDDILNGNSSQKKNIDDYILSLYNLTQNDI